MKKLSNPESSGHFQLANKRNKNARVEWMISLPYYKIWAEKCF